MTLVFSSATRFRLCCGLRPPLRLRETQAQTQTQNQSDHENLTLEMLQGLGAGQFS